jgi:hypothetical protein
MNQQHSFTGTGIPNAQDVGSSPVQQYIHRISVLHQSILDKSSPQLLYRWLAWGGCLLLYLLRVFFLVDGFYIVTYAMAIFNLNLLLGFLTPLELPMSGDDGPGLPSKANDEFRPFVRRLPEFKFWYASLRSILMGTFATFFPIFDVPVFWPILVIYWLILFFVTMKRQIKHMIKYKYVPFSFGKKTYGTGSSVKLAK